MQLHEIRFKLLRAVFLAHGEDLIDLSQFRTVSSFSDLTITSDANGVTIDLTAHGGGTIRLESGSVNDLDAEDFQFYEAEASDRQTSGVEGIRVAVPLRVITRILLLFHRLFREWLAEIRRFNVRALTNVRGESNRYVCR